MFCRRHKTTPERRETSFLRTTAHWLENYVACAEMGERDTIQRPTPWGVALLVECSLTGKASPQGMNATPVGFEPTRGDPIGLAGRRLNHSAKVSIRSVSRVCYQMIQHRVADSTSNGAEKMRASDRGPTRGPGAGMGRLSVPGARVPADGAPGRGGGGGADRRPQRDPAKGTESTRRTQAGHRRSASGFRSAGES